MRESASPNKNFKIANPNEIPAKNNTFYALDCLDSAIKHFEEILKIHQDTLTPILLDIPCSPECGEDNIKVSYDGSEISRRIKQSTSYLNGLVNSLSDLTNRADL